MGIETIYKGIKMKSKFDTNEEYWRWYEEMNNQNILDEYFGEEGGLEYESD